MITTLPKYAGVEQNQTPPVGPTYKYSEKKEKKGVSYYAQQGNRL